MEKASQKAPQKMDIQINYARALAANNKIKESKEILDKLLQYVTEMLSNLILINYNIYYKIM